MKKYRVNVNGTVYEAALAFNISFQLVAVLVMMHISGYDESR